MSAALHPSVCPHDCPSACALDVEVLADGRIGRLGGAAMPYTQGVVCAKVARYAERVHHPDRILHPLRRVGAKGEGRFARISWDEALDEVAARLADAAARDGAEAVWPYCYAGTMGLVQMNALNRLRRAMGWSGQARTICAAIAGAGWNAGVGAKWGIDPREIVESELIVVWGANPAATQPHLMKLIAEARRRHGARLVVIDPYRTPTAVQADLHLALRPGSDGALACAVMQVLLRDGLADRAYLARLTDFSPRVEAHLATRTPDWAAAITGLPAASIAAFARLYGGTRKSWIRVGYGFTRSRNGAANLHAVSCLPAVTGAWAERGGGATQSLGGAFVLDRTLIDALDLPEPTARILDMSRIGPVLAGEDLKGGPPVTAMVVQSSNPALVAPESARVKAGLRRDDLFLAVHEQMMTATARLADLVLPATTFLEHADLYTSYGHTFLQIARPVIAPLGEARSNHWVVAQLARRLGVAHAGFDLDEWALADSCLTASGLPGADPLAAQRWFDCAIPFAKAHFRDGFGHPDGRFRFAPAWGVAGMPEFPDHMASTETADDAHPFRLITPPSRHFLNSTFGEAPSARRAAGRPTALMAAEDCRRLEVTDGDAIRLGNRRGSVVVHVKAAAGIAAGVVAVEGLWPDECFVEGAGINTLTSADAALPAGGAVFHDTAVWVQRVRDRS
ncbi:MAG: molybdopterin-dependent oxidoreductase [Magnetospirillum sp.]|nr:molybdopterin-dependent oxidoreductase [Magnetospirillum sp.]